MRVDKETEQKLIDEGFHYVVGLEPIVFSGAKYLVLGSLPGQESLETGEYYAKNGNRFWPLMAEMFNTRPLTTYADKKAMLKQHHIALWDVYHDGYRKGSKDGYRYATANDIKGFLKKYPTIKKIAVAGKDAYKAFLEEFGDVGIPVNLVTSTSNLNGHYNEQKDTWYSALK